MDGGVAGCQRTLERLAGQRGLRTRSNRGGASLGVPEWHRKGKGNNAQRTFNDITFYYTPFRSYESYVSLIVWWSPMLIEIHETTSPTLKRSAFRVMHQPLSYYPPATNGSK